MVRKIHRCKNCGSLSVAVESFCNICYVICKRCKESTQDCVDEIEAIKEWNKTDGE